MNMRIKKLSVFLSIIFLAGFLACCVLAETEAFTVPALQEVTRNIGLSSGDKVSGSIVVVGGGGNDIDFYVTDPEGNVLFSYERVTQKSFSFVASKTGTYVLHFDNGFSLLASKSVTLDYSVTPSVFGVPQETFIYIVLTVVLVVVVAVLAVVLARKRRGRTETK